MLFGLRSLDAGERQVFASMRSMSVLTDPARGMVQPSRLKVQPAGSAGEFRGLWAALGTNLVPAEEGAILNGVELDESIMKGQWLKLAEKVKRP